MSKVVLEYLAVETDGKGNYLSRKPKYKNLLAEWVSEKRTKRRNAPWWKKPFISTTPHWTTALHLCADSQYLYERNKTWSPFSELGADGWELVCVEGNKAHFKREQELSLEQVLDEIEKNIESENLDIEVKR